MVKIVDMKEFHGKDKRGKFTAELVTTEGAKYAHIRICREDGMENTMIIRTWAAKIMFYIGKILFIRKSEII